MTPRERVRRTLTFTQPDRPPRELWALPRVLRHRGDEYQALLERYPSDFVSVGVHYGPSERARGTPAAVGTYVDEWGSVWGVAEDGVIGEVVEPVLSDWSAFAAFKPPMELFAGASVDEANRICESTDAFVKAGGMIRPFERMQFLRGTENLLMDLAYGVKEVYQLRDMVHEFNLVDLKWLLRIQSDAVFFMDDWGSQQALLISPALWREFFKPLYREYCARIHHAGKFVFFHSDGNIEAIYPDLVEIGIDAVNSQLFCMDMVKLGAEFGGRITFWGEIDRQYLLPFGTPEAVRAAVRQVRLALDNGRGGVIAQCEWGINDPRANIEAVFEAWNEPHPNPLRCYPGQL